MKKNVFVCFDYEKDKNYKNLMKAWDANPNFDFIFKDRSATEIKSKDIPTIKQVLSRKINEATYTLVLVGEDAIKKHEDSEEIGYDNWQIFEIEKSKEHKNKLVAVKLNQKNSSPDSLLDSGVSWAMSFNQEAIIKALNNAK